MNKRQAGKAERDHTKASLNAPASAVGRIATAEEAIPAAKRIGADQKGKITRVENKAKRDRELFAELSEEDLRRGSNALAILAGLSVAE